MKKTAVEFLFHELWNRNKDKLEWHSVLKEAIEMEIKQRRDSFDEGFISGFDKSKFMTSEEYINQKLK